MNIAGGDTADDPINHRDLAAADESGEGEYRNKHRTEKHLSAGKKDHQVCELYTASNCSLVRPPRATQRLSLVCLCTRRVLRRPSVDAKIPRLHRRTIAQLLHMGAG
jgi:hypothetical protein